VLSFCSSFVDVKLNTNSSLRNLIQRRPANLYRSFLRSTSTFGVSVLCSLEDLSIACSTSLKRNVCRSHSHCLMMLLSSCISRSSFSFSAATASKSQKKSVNFPVASVGLGSLFHERFTFVCRLDITGVAVRGTRRLHFRSAGPLYQQ